MCSYAPIYQHHFSEKNVNPQTFNWGLYAHNYSKSSSHFQSAFFITLVKHTSNSMQFHITFEANSIFMYQVCEKYSYWSSRLKIKIYHPDIIGQNP